jgi:hypothetical protein
MINRQRESTSMQLDQAFAELNLVQDFIPLGNSNRPGTRLVPRLITIHNTDNDSPGANAAAHAKYQKGEDARRRKVSWHFTVDDRGVFQSLPTNEVGWHAGTREGNSSSIGIEICMHPEMNVDAAYQRAALLVAVMARRLGVTVPAAVVQHHHWSGKHCPRVLRDKPHGWDDFLQTIAHSSNDLRDITAPDIIAGHDHHEGETGSGAPVGASEEFTVIARDGLRVRAGPGTDFDIKSSLAFGTKVVVISHSGAWAMVDLNGDGIGGDGFVQTAFLKRG